MKRTYWYAAMTKDEVQHSRMTFYEAVNIVLLRGVCMHPKIVNGRG
jgi:hypothetical protein